MAAPVLFSVILAILLRFICFRTYLSSILADRIEVVTPLTSWTRIIEGITLMEQGISPYVGAIFHETPLCLHLFKYLYSITPLIIPTIFIALDLLIGIVLYSAAQNGIKYMLRRQKREQVRYAKGVEALHLDQSAFTEIPKLVLYIYLLNPFTIFTCCAKSTILLTNLAVALAFQFTFQDSPMHQRSSEAQNLFESPQSSESTSGSQAPSEATDPPLVHPKMPATPQEMECDSESRNSTEKCEELKMRLMIEEHQVRIKMMMEEHEWKREQHKWLREEHRIRLNSLIRTTNNHEIKTNHLKAS